MYMCIFITDQVVKKHCLMYMYFHYRPGSKEALYDVYMYFHYRPGSKEALFDVYVYFFFYKDRAVRRTC